MSNGEAHYGYVWLNRIFVKRGSSFRLWKTSDIRLSRFEAVVIILLAIILMGISVPIIFLLMKWSFVSDNINLWPFIFVNLLIAWLMGRSLAKASPYSRHTGENIFDWLTVASDKRNTLLGRVVGHRVQVNEVTSWISGKPQSVEAVEWLGSARAPSAPPRTADMSEDDLVPVYLVPSTEATDWVDQKRRARRARYYAESAAAANVSNFQQEPPAQTVEQRPVVERPVQAPTAPTPPPPPVDMPPPVAEASKPQTSQTQRSNDTAFESSSQEYRHKRGVSAQVQEALTPETVDFDPFFDAPQVSESQVDSVDDQQPQKRNTMKPARGIGSAEATSEVHDEPRRKKFGKRGAPSANSSGSEAGF